MESRLLRDPLKSWRSPTQRQPCSFERQADTLGCSAQHFRQKTAKEQWTKDACLGQVIAKLLKLGAKHRQMSGMGTSQAHSWTEIIHPSLFVTFPVYLRGPSQAHFS
eukprot:scaffold76246_cov20-Tisochrysis_lutea.AAC.1